jgi:competence protein ComGC
LNAEASNDANHPRPSFRKSVILSTVIVVALWVGLTAAWNTRQVQLRMKCSANLQKIGIALSAYAAQHNEAAPSLNGLRQLGLLDPAHLVCPSAKQPNYILVRHSQGKARPGEGVLVFEPLSNHGHGANNLFVDGTCKFVPKGQLPER